MACRCRDGCPDAARMRHCAENRLHKLCCKHLHAWAAVQAGCFSRLPQRCPSPCLCYPPAPPRPCLFHPPAPRPFLGRSLGTTPSTCSASGPPAPASTSWTFGATRTTTRTWQTLTSRRRCTGYGLGAWRGAMPCLLPQSTPKAVRFLCFLLAGLAAGTHLVSFHGNCRHSCWPTLRPCQFCALCAALVTAQERRYQETQKRLEPWKDKVGCLLPLRNIGSSVSPSCLPLQLGCLPLRAESSPAASDAAATPQRLPA